MIVEEIRELQRATPFEPYTIGTNDGKSFHVKHPDYLLIPPHQQTLYVYSTETAREIVGVSNITGVVPGAKKARLRRH
jgi:hypothetical protein